MTSAEDKHQGTILRIQRMSTEDGPGIRSTVFFKGCPLTCIWCHNPESISPRPQVHWVKSRCIGCRGCIEACPKGALAFGDNGITINRVQCDSCSECVQACPSTAMEAYGEVFSADDLVREVIKDKVYFQKSGGGVTLSGGEPTMQPVFTKELLSSLKQKGVNTALDTCGQCSWETLEALLPQADLVLYDLKEIDPENHKRFTGITNKRYPAEPHNTGALHEGSRHARGSLDTHTFNTGLHGNAGKYQGHRRLHQEAFAFSGKQVGPVHLQ